MKWLTGLTELRERAEVGVLITLVSVRGHAPREAGAKMTVSVRETWDSIGGGNLEMTAVERARAMLAAGVQEPQLITLSLTPGAAQHHARQCCGGEVAVLLEPLPLSRPTLVIFGAGHVGRALARVMERLPWAVHVVDSREGLPDEVCSSVPGVGWHHVPIPETFPVPAGAFIVIMTHDHAEDIALCDAALRHPELSFIGLIGSKVKWVHFQEQLRREGHAPDAVQRITTPIGLPGIHGKTPEVIALSVAAQLQQLYEEKQARQRQVTPALK